MGMSIDGLHAFNSNLCYVLCYLLSMASMFDAFRSSVQVPKKDGTSRVHAFNMIF